MKVIDGIVHLDLDEWRIQFPQEYEDYSGQWPFSCANHPNMRFGCKHPGARNVYIRYTDPIVLMYKEPHWFFWTKPDDCTIQQLCRWIGHDCGCPTSDLMRVMPLDYYHTHAQLDTKE